MILGQSICLLIPTLNEEEGLAVVLGTLPSYIDRILVVDSHSTDKTTEVAKSFNADVVFEPRPGYGRAIRTGFENVKEDWVVTLDADGTYPTHEIEYLVKYAIQKNLKFLSASRFPLLNNHAVSQRNFLGNTFITWLTNMLFGTKMVDGSSGMWVIHKSILPLLELTRDDWLFSNEIKIAAALHPEIRFHEKTIIFYPRVGETKATYPWIIGLKLLVYLLFRRLYIKEYEILDKNYQTLKE